MESSMKKKTVRYEAAELANDEEILHFCDELTSIAGNA
jgi:hypothetical protein